MYFNGISKTLQTSINNVFLFFPLIHEHTQCLFIKYFGGESEYNIYIFITSCLSIHSQIDILFPNFVYYECAAMNTDVQISISVPAFDSCVLMSISGIAGYGILCLIFLKNQSFNDMSLSTLFKLWLLTEILIVILELNFLKVIT